MNAIIIVVFCFGWIAVRRCWRITAIGRKRCFENCNFWIQMAARQANFRIVTSPFFNDFCTMKKIKKIDLVKYKNSVLFQRKQLNRKTDATFSMFRQALSYLWLTHSFNEIFIHFVGRLFSRFTRNGKPKFSLISIDRKTEIFDEIENAFELEQEHILNRFMAFGQRNLYARSHIVWFHCLANGNR